MKPSERIEEIVRTKGGVDFFQDFMPNPEVKAILQYLDEEWEKKGCQYGNHDDEVWNDRYRCKRCGNLS